MSGLRVSVRDMRMLMKRVKKPDFRYSSARNQVTTEPNFWYTGLTRNGFLSIPKYAMPMLPNNTHLFIRQVAW